METRTEEIKVATDVRTVVVDGGDRRAPEMSAADTAPPMLPDKVGFIRRVVRKIRSAIDWLFGAVTLLFALAALSVIPILNFASLGYLLQASANVAQSGRLRDAFIGVRKASRLGGLLIGVWLALLPLRFVSGLWRDAELVNPGGADGWRVATIILMILTTLHLTWACIRGARLRHFLWPAPIRLIRWLFHPTDYASIRDGVLDYLASLRLPHYFWLGARGFAGAFLWLIGPVGVMILASKLPPGGAAVLSLFASIPLMLAVMYLPFLQTRFACENRFRAMFEVRETRALFRRAPVAFWCALFITLLFAIPLYLLKVELTPQEVAWFPALIFVAFIFPARALTGWAVGRAFRREQPRLWLSRWLARMAILPVAGIYALITYFTQFMSWHGARALLEHHAFMVPAPLLGL